MNEKKNTRLYILIAILCALVLALGSYIIFDKIIDKEKSNNKNTNNNVTDIGNSTLTGKIDFNNYCSNNSICKKEIGNININDQTLKLSVDLKDLNTENVNGYITLGTKKLNISNLSNFKYEKVIDGFEIYQSYLILYMSNLNTITSTNTNCKAKGYTMYILDANLEEVSSIAGYTKNNAFKDFKIENDYLYYYAISTTNVLQAPLIYAKIKFNDLSNKKYDNYEIISSIDECNFGN